MDKENQEEFDAINARIDAIELTILELAKTASTQAELGQKTVNLLKDMLKSRS